jgi:hypothetical protein
MKVLWWTVSEWQAYGTVALVVVTSVYVVLTWLIASRAREAAEASNISAIAARDTAEIARKSAETGERSLLLQMMPLVFGAEVKTHRADKSSESLTEAILYGTGFAPAFNLEITVEQGEHVGSTGPISHYDPVRDGLRPIEVPAFELAKGEPYSVVVTYYDALGNGYRTLRNSLLGGQSLTTVERFDESTGEFIPLVGE